MVTKGRVVEPLLAPERLGNVQRSGGERPSAERRRQSPPASDDDGLLWRIILVVVGFGVAMVGWLLVLTVILSFLGLPLFIVGLALMQAQER